MKRFIFAIFMAATLSFMLIPSAQAQDERFLRELLSERFLDSGLRPSVTNQYFRTVSPFYELDLDGNGRHETLVFEKAGGRDFIHIHAYNGKRLFSGEFTPLGERSHVFKVNFRSIGGGYKVLLLHYYEGFQDYLEFMGTSRLYMVTFKDISPTSFSFDRGPLLWTEHKDQQGNYIQRAQHVVTHDFNGDGVKEISVRYDGINRVYFFNGKGWWGLN